MTRYLKWDMEYVLPSFTMGKRTIDWKYYFDEGIYPNFRIFIKTISRPTTQKEMLFATAQKLFRKASESFYTIQFSR